MKRVETFFSSIGVASLFLVLTLILCHFAILLWGMYKSSQHPLTSYQASAYKHLSDNQIDDLLAWTWNPGFVFEPWLGFREKARTSAYVNVSNLGTRFNDLNENPDDRTEGAVWFFGGSTTFGYGVADRETIPAQLARHIRQPVVNFGRANYYSAQENFLLSWLLMSGYKPSAVVFLDGINERCDIEFYQTEFARLFDKAQTYHWDPTEVFKPFFSIARRLENRFGIRRTGYSFSNQCVRRGKKVPLSSIVAANLSERRDVCRRYAVKCLVFVQPFAGVHGVHQDYVMLPPADRNAHRDKFNYLSSTWKDFDAIFVVDALRPLHEHAFVDGNHYSVVASELVARAIAVHLQEQN